MPDKRHRWMVVMPFEVTDQDAQRMATGDGLPSIEEQPAEELARGEAPKPDDPRPWFGLHNVAQDLIGVVCWDCEQPWTKEVAGQGCLGQPTGKLAYVDEQGRDLNPDEVISAPTPPAPQAGLGSVGRNDPCPCGSGLKFKRCHGSPTGGPG